MATVGHLALGLAAGRVQAGERRLRFGACLLFAILGALPDVDLLATLLGHPDALPHRGPTHSLVFAALVGLLLATVPETWRAPSSRLRTAVLGFLSVVSHTLVDPLIAGSGGTSLLWPFSAWRFTWGAFQPLPEAFIGFSWPFVAPAQLALEALIFSPLVVYALWQRRPDRAPIPLVLPSSQPAPAVERATREA